MKLDPDLRYSRKNNVIYQEGKPFLKLLQNFIDIENLSGEGLKYMNRYLELNPNLYMKIVKIFFDLETTGVDKRKHGIHQISGIIEVNDEVAETFNFKVAPNPKALIEIEAMNICRVTEEIIRAYPDMKTIYRQFIELLSKYIDKFDNKQKAYLVGFNNRYFDDVFLRCWFEQNGDSFFGSWFWTDTLDTLVLASQYLINRRQTMPSFKLKRVAKELGIMIDESKLHDAEYDVYLTREIYRIVTGLEIEI